MKNSANAEERVAVTLEPEESTVLMEVLRTYGADLRMEIADTDNPIYKRPLKRQREILETIVKKLETAAADAPTEEPFDGAVSLRIVAVW